jgi:uncharacterized protein YlaI
MLSFGHYSLHEKSEARTFLQVLEENGGSALTVRKKRVYICPECKRLVESTDQRHDVGLHYHQVCWERRRIRRQGAPGERKLNFPHQV